MSDNQESTPDPNDVLTDLKRIRDLIRHIRNVQEAAIRICEKCIEDGQAEFGRNLIANAFIHDQSKFRGIEWLAIGNTNPEQANLKAIAIKHHQKLNNHHPEYWLGIHNMPEIYLAEMVCDTYARSVEMGTNLREWWNDCGVKKYDISKKGKTWKTIKKYIDMILDEEFR